MNSLVMRDENVLKIMSGLKTMSRRVIEQPPSWATSVGSIVWPWVHFHGYHGPKPCESKKCGHLLGDSMFTVNARHRVGDIVYIKEAHAFKKGADIRETYIGTTFESVLGDPPHYAYRASEPHWGEFTEGAMKGQRCFRWRSPRFMPRKAARVFIKINLLRVERLKDISHADADAEGFKLPEVKEGTVVQEFPSPIYGFRSAWNAIHGKSIGVISPFELNPWVLVIGFEKVDAPAPCPRKPLFPVEATT